MKIVLVGFMGTGKTVVGRILARRLGYRFIDTDRLVETRAGRSIAEIFALAGEAAFRSLEKEAVAGLAETDRAVIATGGGVVLDPENMASLGCNGRVFALLADPAEIARRTASQRHRPLLEVAEPEARIRELLEKRLPYYRRADHSLETTGRTPEAVAGEIIKLLEAAENKKGTPPMKVIGIIPARYQSKRFPGKVMADLAGRPLIEHICRRAGEAKRLNEVWVAADDDRVVEAVRAFGGRVRKLAGDFICGTDRIAALAAELDGDVYLNLQADEPLMAPEVIDAVAGAFDDPSVQMATAVTPLTRPEDWEDTNAVKTVLDRNSDCLYFSRAAIPYDRDNQGRRPASEAYKHLGIYGYRAGFLARFAAWPPTPLEKIERLEQLRALEHGVRIRSVITPFDSLSVDTPEDLARVARFLKERGD